MAGERAGMDRKLFDAATSDNTHFLTQLSISDPSHLLLLQLTPKKNTALHIASRQGHKDFAAAIYNLCPHILNAKNSSGDTALHVAAKAGHSTVVEFLVDISTSSFSESRELLRKRNKEGNTALHEAVQNHRCTVVELLTKADPELSVLANSAGVSPLHLAVEEGSLENVHLILQACKSDGRDPLANRGPDERTLLHTAAVWRHYDIVELLLKEKPELVRQLDGHGRTTLHHAASLGDLKTASHLLGCDASTGYCIDRDGFSPLHMAASKGHVNVIRELIKCCPDSGELVDRRGCNVLHIAIERKDLKVVKYVLQAAELEDLINEPDSDGNTPLHRAIIIGDIHILHFLVEDHRVDVRAMNKAGFRALDMVGSDDELSTMLQKVRLDIMKEKSRIKNNGKIEVMDRKLHKAVTKCNIELLRQLGNGNPNPFLSTTPQKNTALHIAARLGHVQLVQEILGQCEILLRRTNSRGDTPFHVAARAGHVEIVEYLMKFQRNKPEWNCRGVEIWRTHNKENNTALHEAVRNGHYNVGVFLITMAPELSYFVNSAGESPLYLAAEGGSLEIVRQILNASISFAHGGPDGRTALHAAVIKGHHDIMIELLTKRKELIKQTDDHGKTPLHYAASLGNISMVQWLVQFDTSTAYDIDNEGQSPIHMAARYGHVNIIQDLIMHCPDSMELLDTKGRNALHVAIEEGKENVIKYALDNPDLDYLLNELDDDGNTPLRLAAIKDNGTIMRILLEDKRVRTVLMKNACMKSLNIGGRSGNELGNVVTQFLASGDLRNISTPPDQQPVHDEITETIPNANQSSVEAAVAQQVQHGVETAENAGNTMQSSAEEPPSPQGRVVTRLDTRQREAVQRESYKAKATTISLVATLVATVTFAAAFTMPGGYQSNAGSDQGMAILVRKASFKAFLILDTIAMCTSILIVFVPIWPGIDDPDYSDAALEFAAQALQVTLYAMLLAFITAVYAVVSDCRWLAIFICVIGCLTLLVVGVLLTSDAHGATFLYWTPDRMEGTERMHGSLTGPTIVGVLLKSLFQKMFERLRRSRSLVPEQNVETGFPSGDTPLLMSIIPGN